MRKLKTWIAIGVLIAILLGLSHRALAPPDTRPMVEISLFSVDYSFIDYRIYLINSIISVESGSDIKAFNRRENAAGVLQIRPIYIREAKMQLGSNFKTWNRFDYLKSINLFLEMNDKLNPQYDLELTAHYHNAGFYHAKKTYRITKRYRQKVMNEFNKYGYEESVYGVPTVNGNFSRVICPIKIIGQDVRVPLL